MKKLILFLLLFTTFSLTAQNEQQSFTLKEAVDYAQKNHINVKGSELNLEDAEQQILETRSLGLPKLNATLDYNYYLALPTSLIPAEFFGGAPGSFQQVAFGTNNNLTVALGASWNVFDGSYLVALRAAETFMEYTRVEAEQVNRELKNNVTKTYLMTLILKENQAIIERNIAILEKQYGEAQATFKEGFIEQLDVDRLDLSLRNLRTDLEGLKRQQEMAVNALKFSMGYKIEDDLVVEDDIEGLLESGFTATPDEPINLGNRPNINLIDKALELNDQDVERQEALKLPVVSTFLNYQMNLQTNNLFESPFDWFPISLVGLSVRYPIFDGFYARTKIQRAKIAKEQTLIQRQAVVDAINLEVTNARIAYKNALEQLDKQKQNLALAERIYKTTQIKFKEGVGTSLELSQAEQSLYGTQANYLNALYDLLTAKADLDIALGK